MEQTLELGEMEQSVVKELANIGLGHATTALADMTGRAFNMSIPYVEPIALEEVPNRLGNAEEVSIGISMPIAGEAEGHIVFISDWESAQTLWRMLLGAAPADASGVGALEASAMLEIGNIINSSFLSAISDMTNMRLESTPPMMALDMAASILTSVVAEASLGEHYALAIRTEINDENGSFKGFFLYVPTLDGLRIAFRRLGLPEAA
ncbi:MAG: chemotaxis protein CheC [Fimbriimonas sp.]